MAEANVSNDEKHQQLSLLSHKTEAGVNHSLKFDPEGRFVNSHEEVKAFVSLLLAMQQPFLGVA